MSDQSKDADPGTSQPKEAPIRVCPNCSAQTQTSDDICPYCGASFIRSRSRRAKKRVGEMSRRSKLLIGAVLVGLLVGGAVVGVVAKVDHDNKIAAENKEAEEARELAKEEAAEEAQEVREEAKAEAALERIEVKFGHESQTELEEAITKDANSEAEEGFSDYVSDTLCEPDGGVIDTSQAAQDFSCLAVTSEENGVSEGYRYSGTINYKKGEFSWRYGGE